MSNQVTLNNLVTLQSDSNAVGTINSNNAIISSALANTVSLTGTSPNQMQSNLDMNSNQVLNLPSPATLNSPVRLVDVAGNPTITVPPVGTSGATVPLLSGNNTWSGSNTFSNIAGSTTSGTTTLAGTVNVTGTISLPTSSVTSANIIDNAVANNDIRQSSGLSVIGTAGSSTANVADITGTTRQVLAINTAGTALAFAQPQGDQLKGTVAADNASAGNIGEYITSTAQNNTLVTATNTNITSISLTAGDWDVNGSFAFSGGSGTVITGLAGSLSATSATLDTTFNRTAVLAGSQSSNVNTSGIGQITLNCGPSRFSVTTTTTIFGVARADFTTASEGVNACISARRVR